MKLVEEDDHFDKIQKIEEKDESVIKNADQNEHIKERIEKDAEAEPNKYVDIQDEDVQSIKSSINIDLDNESSIKE